MIKDHWQTREPVVAGSFYSSSAQTLKKQCADFFSAVEKIPFDFETKAIIVPHAGYMYSGKVAAYAYKAVAEKSFETIIVIGPSHHLAFDGASVFYGDYKTPFGIAKNSSAFVEMLLKFNPQKIFPYPLAHQQEHSVEVQFPFLQYLFPQPEIIPIVIGNPTLENTQILAAALVDCLKHKKSFLIVASTDFSHFYNYDQAVKMDNRALSYISNFDTQGLLRAVKQRECELCGLGSVLTVLLFFSSLQSKAIKILKYANSGDVTGDKRSVVGYAAAVVGVYE